MRIFRRAMHFVDGILVFADTHENTDPQFKCSNNEALRKALDLEVMAGNKLNEKWLGNIRNSKTKDIHICALIKETHMHSIYNKSVNEVKRQSPEVRRDPNVHCQRSAVTNCAERHSTDFCANRKRRYVNVMKIRAHTKCKDCTNISV